MYASIGGLRLAVLICQIIVWTKTLERVRVAPGPRWNSFPFSSHKHHSLNGKHGVCHPFDRLTECNRLSFPCKSYHFCATNSTHESRLSLSFSAALADFHQRRSTLKMNIIIDLHLSMTITAGG